MNLELSNIVSDKKSSLNWNFFIVCFALIAGLALSIVSGLEICIKYCAATNDYQLFGFPFELMGILFFVTAIALHLLSLKYNYSSLFVGWMIAASLGAELMFIFVQKYQIGHWCPICLSIATCVLIAGITLSYDYFKNLFQTIQYKKRDEIMSTITRGFSSLAFMILGLLMAFVGVQKVDAVATGISEIKQKIVFGNKNSPIEVYFATDWYCPSCRKIEPMIEKLLPKIKSQVAFYFIDYAIHKKSINYTPYNLAFMMNDKAYYFKARELLTQMAAENEKPIDDEVTAAAKKAKIPFKELTFLDVKSGIDYFDEIKDKYQMNATPTLIITNSKTNKAVKLEGADEITEEAILKGIETIKKAT
jgi:protein-disulfide isomerase